MLNPPAPRAIINLVKCSCKKGCGTNICSCKKNGIVCTEACQCSAGNFFCKNTPDLVTPSIMKEYDEDNSGKLWYFYFKHIMNNQKYFLEDYGGYLRMFQEDKKAISLLVYVY